MGIETLHGEKILVVGLGNSGYSVCEFLQRMGIAFDVVDDREAPPKLASLREHLPDVRIWTSFDAELFCQYDVLVVSPGLAVSLPAIAAARQHGAELIGDVELFARSVTAPVIAVTGSNGKSTVVAWLAAALQHASMQAVACGNIGLPSLDALAQGAQVYVLELSSFQLETTESLTPISAAVLNVSEDHMDRYDDIEHYAATKRHIYSQASVLVCNAEDERTHPVVSNDAQEFDAVEVIEFGARDISSHTVSSAQHKGEEWLVMGAEYIIPVAELPLPGAHNLANAQAVIALARPLGISASDLRAGLKSFHGLPHRTQLVAVHNGVRWYNDSKGTNVDACSKAIEAMQAPVVLIAGGQGKDADFSELRPMVSQHVKAMVLIGQDADKLLQSLQDLAPCERADSMPDAVAKAAQIAVAGDAVLLSPACASFDMFKSFEHRGDAFTDAVLKVAA